MKTEPRKPTAKAQFLCLNCRLGFSAKPSPQKSFKLQQKALAPTQGALCATCGQKGHAAEDGFQFPLKSQGRAWGQIRQNLSPRRDVRLAKPVELAVEVVPLQNQSPPIRRFARDRLSPL